MLVQCPKCKTTYKVSDEVVVGASPAFRCSRCKHTFEPALGSPKSSNASKTALGESDSSQELPSGPQPEKSSELEWVREESENASAAADAANATAGMPEWEPRESADLPRDRPLEIVRTGGEAKPSSAEEISTPRFVRERPFQFATPPRESSDNVFAIEPYREQPASVAPFLTLFGLLVVFFAFLLGFSRARPDAAERWLVQIPIVGPSVARNNHLKNGVLLRSIEPRFQSPQGSRDVLVVAGVAVNQNPVLIRNVQIRGQLYDQEGNEIERQTMWIGNAISAQIIRGMSTQDIADLQRLKPLKSFEIPPGDSVPFAIVFLRAGKQVKDARFEVLSAEGNA